MNCCSTTCKLSRISILIAQYIELTLYTFPNFINRLNKSIKDEIKPCISIANKFTATMTIEVLSNIRFFGFFAIMRLHCKNIYSQREKHRD